MSVVIAEIPLILGVSLRPLRLSDKPDIDAVTERYPLCSDFQFANLWAWDTRAAIRWAAYRGALIVQLTDRRDEGPSHMLLADEGANAIAHEVLMRAEASDLAPVLMAPEPTAAVLDQRYFRVEEMRDSFDYIYDLGQRLACAGRKHESRRRLLKRFRSEHPSYCAVPLDLSEPTAQHDIEELWRRWTMLRGDTDRTEWQAYQRLLAASRQFDCLATGIYVGRTLVAFDVTALVPSACALGLFAKADRSFRGAFAILDHEVARLLLGKGYTHINFQEDLGIPSLRDAKMRARPTEFVRKYAVRRRS